MSIAVIKPQEFAELSNKGTRNRSHRRAYARRISGGPCRLRSKCSGGSNRSRRALIKARYVAANEPYYVICRSGSRGQQACEKFLKAGFSNVVNIEGGTEAWVAAGLPVVRGKKSDVAGTPGAYCGWVHRAYRSGRRNGEPKMFISQGFRHSLELG